MVPGTTGGGLIASLLNQSDIKNAMLSPLSSPRLQHLQFPLKTHKQKIFPHGFLGLNLMKSVGHMCLFMGV